MNNLKIKTKENNMQTGIRDTLATITTKDLNLRGRRDNLKLKLRVTDEEIYRAGIEYLENNDISK